MSRIPSVLFFAAAFALLALIVSPGVVADNVKSALAAVIIACTIFGSVAVLLRKTTTI